MSILDSIKGERKLSFGNWRFRILHWAFNVETPNQSNWQFTGLPRFLYTHYCPLFHLTNLIALLSPLILGIKFLFLVGRSIAAVLDLIPLERICSYFRKMLPSLPEKVVKTPVVTFEDDKKRLIVLICSGYTDFERLWAGHCFSAMSREAAEAVFNEYYPQVVAARKRAQERKEKWRQRIIFWTNFSRVFIKWAMNVAYFALAGVFLYILYAFSGIAWHGICWCAESLAWLFTDAISFSFLVFLGKLAWTFGVAYVFIYFLLRFGVFQKFVDVFASGISYITPPFYLVAVHFRWIKSGWNNICEFVSMFYEENCPPIKIVSETEAVVESVAQNGEEV
jgi:ABC-type multidrug transport system fused ATPase/permease subunit